MQLKPVQTGARRAAGVVFLCLTLLVPMLRAQSSSSSSSSVQEEEQRSFLRRFSVGVRATILATDIQNPGTTQSSPNSLTSVAQTLTPKTSRIGGGVTVEYDATPRILVNVDLLYRYFGYEDITSTSVTNADGETQLTVVEDSTGGRYWDLPIMVRYGSRPSRTASARLLAGGGVVFRRVSNLKSSSLTTKSDGTQVADHTPPVPFNRTTYGVMASVGFRVKDDFGIKLTPELRYIRWLNDLFNSWPGQQRRNELQIVIGLTF